MSRQKQIIAVVIKQYGTGLYRTCVSLGKGNMTYLGTYGDERSATEKIGQFWKAWDEGQIRQPEDLQQLVSDQPVATPLSESTRIEITPLAA